MDKITAQLQGKKWIEFKDIPQTIRTLYDLTLTIQAASVGVYGLKEQFQKTEGAYEYACEYWWNNQINDVIDRPFLDFDSLPKNP